MLAWQRERQAAGTVAGLRLCISPPFARNEVRVVQVVDELPHELHTIKQLGGYWERIFNIFEQLAVFFELGHRTTLPLGLWDDEVVEASVEELAPQLFVHWKELHDFHIAFYL